MAPRFLAESKYVSGLNIECAYNPMKESADIFSIKEGLNAIHMIINIFLIM